MMAYDAYGQPIQGQTWGQPRPAYPTYQQSYAPAPVQMPNTPIPQKPIFVEGEMAARVFQMPDNWPVLVPLYLWDTSGNVFYIKMLDASGVPVPLQAFDYQRREMTSGYISGTSGPDMSQYITKDAFEAKMNELKDMLQRNQTGRNQNGSNNGQNRGGNQ